MSSPAGAGPPARSRFRPSRRLLLGSAAAVVAAAAPIGYWELHRHRGPVTMRPLAAADVLAGIAVNAHPSYAVTSYGDVEAWIERLASSGTRSFRGLYDPDSAGCQQAVTSCREHSIGWIMLVVPESRDAPTEQTPEQTAEIVRHIEQTCPDVCTAIEGLNEPDNNSSGAPVPADWAATTAAHQRAIWDTVQDSTALAHVDVIGPSLHDVATMASYRTDDAAGGPRHYEQLARTGIARWLDRIGLHHYPSGDPPMTGIDDRLTLIHQAFGAGMKVHLTETGYTNALRQPTNAAGTYIASQASFGNRPVSPEASAVYLPQAYLKAAALDLPTAWYELLDDPDPGDQVTESNFGLWSVTGTDAESWSPKPAVAALTRLTASLTEPAGPAYRPDPVTVDLVAPAGAQLTSVATARRDGTTTLHLFRDLPVWDPVHRTAIEVGSVEVIVRDRRGTRSVGVGPQTVSVDLR